MGTGEAVENMKERPLDCMSCFHLLLFIEKSKDAMTNLICFHIQRDKNARKPLAKYYSFKVFNLQSSTYILNNARQQLIPVTFVH